MEIKNGKIKEVIEDLKLIKDLNLTEICENCGEKFKPNNVKNYIVRNNEMEGDTAELQLCKGCVDYLRKEEHIDMLTNEKT